jgi:hypothetical protein
VGIRMVNYYTWHHGALYVSKPKSNVVQSKKRNKGKIYYLNYDDLRQKVSGIPRMVYSNKIISLLTQASYQGWFAHETTVRSTNYSIGPLATALFNDPFS